MNDGPGAKRAIAFFDGQNLFGVRIPAQADHRFRSKPIASGLLCMERNTQQVLSRPDRVIWVTGNGYPLRTFSMTARAALASGVGISA